ncbi:MAG: CHAP domain-containing protein [Polyangiaceae bacterium]
MTALAMVVTGLDVSSLGCASSSGGKGSPPPPAGSGSPPAASSGSSSGSGAGGGNDDGGSVPVAAEDSGGSSPTPPAPADDGSTPPPASAFSCSPAGIATYADQLVTATRKVCTSDGVGVVDDKNYSCIEGPIDSVNPPDPAASYNIISTLLDGNTSYPLCECTYFVQAVTAGVCGTPISPPSIPWTDYPLAAQFVGQTIAGYTWMTMTASPVQAGDILLYQAQGPNDPGHIMIVAQVVDSSHFRIAEANDLNPDGTPGTTDTGVISNTRIETLDDSLLAGLFRLTSTTGK